MAVPTGGGVARRETWTVVSLVVLVVGLLGLKALSGTAITTGLDRVVFDFLAKHALEHPDEKVDGITVILVDDESLDGLGERWPLSRGTWARFMTRLAELQPAAVGVDAWFATPAPQDALDLAYDLSDRMRFGRIDQLPAGALLLASLDEMTFELDRDRRFAEAIANHGRVVLGVVCEGISEDTRQENETVGLTPLPDGLLAGEAPVRCPRVATSIPSLALSARAQAGLRVMVDPDGVIRRYPYVFGYKGGLYPTLALGASSVALADRSEAFQGQVAAADGGAPLLRPLPIDRFRQMRFSDVLMAADSDALQRAIRDQIVYVGVSASGTEDFVRLPLDYDVPGVYTHAIATWNLLNGEHLQTTGASARLGFFGGSLVIIGLAAVGRRFRTGPTIIGAAGVAASAWFVVAWIALGRGLVIPVVPVVAGALGWGAVRIGYQLLRGEAARERARAIRRAFDQYLAPAVVEELVANPEKLRLGGDRREITAFFSDVKGFTTISESLDPAELIELLNECLGEMTGLLIEEGGTIDKYIGDAIVGMFGAPVEQPDHAVRACVAAWRCQRRLAELRDKWKVEGRPELQVRIGLNSGPALVGNMGSAQRFDYTMLGDTVNLAARLEGTNSAYGTWILIGENTAARVGDEILLRELDLVRVKGKLKPIRVFELLAPAEAATVAQQQLKERSEAALAAYRRQAWPEARELLQALVDDGDAWAEIFLARVAAFESEPPGPDWDGVYIMTTK